MILNYEKFCESNNENDIYSILRNNVENGTLYLGRDLVIDQVLDEEILKTINISKIESRISKPINVTIQCDEIPRFILESKVDNINFVIHGDYYRKEHIRGFKYNLRQLTLINSSIRDIEVETFGLDIIRPKINDFNIKGKCNIINIKDAYINTLNCINGDNISFYDCNIYDVKNINLNYTIRGLHFTRCIFKKENDILNLVIESEINRLTFEKCNIKGIKKLNVTNDLTIENCEIDNIDFLRDTAPKAIYFKGLNISKLDFLNRSIKTLHIDSNKKPLEISNDIPLGSIESIKFENTIIPSDIYIKYYNSKPSIVSNSVNHHMIYDLSRELNINFKELSKLIVDNDLDILQFEKNEFIELVKGLI